MDYVTVALAALVVSALVLYSGFGLGTLLMPVFALFFPIPVAVASTAVVHLSNNVFKIVLVGRRANWHVVWLFGLPAAVLAILGAVVLLQLSEIAPLMSYDLGGRTFDVTLLKLVVALLIFGFAAFELVPHFEKIEFPRQWIPLGGALSGFFGGLSGHQGALRSAVLAKAGLSTESFVGTTSICAFLVDVSRLIVYGATFFLADFGSVAEGNSIQLVGVATVAAFIGTYISSKFLRKITMSTIRTIVGVLLVAIGVALAAGLA